MTDRSDLPSRHPDPLPWLAAAACRGMNPSLFFADEGEHLREAKAVRAGCPVRGDCLDAGRREKWGIWGGLSERERRRVGRAA